MAFLFVFFFWDSYDLNVGAFSTVLEVSETVIISFNSFTFKVIIDKYDPVAVYFIVLDSSLYTISMFPV